MNASLAAARVCSPSLETAVRHPQPRPLQAAGKVGAARGQQPDCQRPGGYGQGRELGYEPGQPNWPASTGTGIGIGIGTKQKAPT